MLTSNDTMEETPVEKLNISRLFIKNGLEEEIDNFVKSTTNRIDFSIIIKPAIISFVALIISFFMDISYVPILGNITMNIAHSLFPSWQPAAQPVEPYKFWWLPVFIYGLFVLFAYLAYQKLKVEMVRNPASETIDRVITSYTSIIDSIATALPLLGAAILLISIKLGEDVFLGLSVPFEIKSLIVLALGKLFEPVLDQLGVEFQNIANHVADIKERYFSRIQIENSKNILKRLSGNNEDFEHGNHLSIKELEEYNYALEKTSRLSETIKINFQSAMEILDKLNKIPSIDTENIQSINKLADSVTTAARSLSDEKTIAGLKHLESIVLKK